MFSEVRTPRLGFTSSDPLSELDPDMLITGSKNMMLRGRLEWESVGGWGRATYTPSSTRGGDLSFLVGRGWATVGDELGEGSGNIVEFVGRSLWFVGSGDITVFQPGITATPQALGNSPLQNGIPQVAVLNQAKNGYSLPVQVGLLPEQTAPFLVIRGSVGAGFEGTMNGTYSIVYTWLRDSTGGESLPSDPSNTITLANQTMLVNFPNLTTNTPLPRDKWRIYATKTGFGETGPYFFLTEVPYRRVNDEFGVGFAVEDSGGSNFNLFRLNPLVSGYFSSEQIGKRIFWDSPTVYGGSIVGVTGNTFTYRGVTYGDYAIISPAASSISTLVDNWDIDPYIDGYENAIELEWNDNELAAIQPPTDFFPPATTAQFIVALVNLMILVGTEDGLGVAVSVPNFPEAYPPDFRLQLPEPPIGVLARPEDGFFYIVCYNSVHEIRWTGAVDGPPVTIRTIANQLGAIDDTAMAQAGEDIYLFNKAHKPARILGTGLIDTQFGDRIEDETKTWTAGPITISFDERRGAIMYGYIDRQFLYYPQYDVWTPPIFPADTETAGRPSGSLRSMFTKDGLIHQSYYTTEMVTATITAGTNAINTGASFFDHTHLGKKVSIPGAGAGPSTLTAFITSIPGPTQALISTNAVNDAIAQTVTINGFDMWTFDRDVNDSEFQYSTSWRVRYAFGDYGVGIMPKTVTKAKIGLKSSVGTYNLRFYRNYDITNQMGTTRTFVGASGSHIQSVVDCNNGEAELLSPSIDGTGVRNKLYFFQLWGTNSGINTNFGV